MNRSLAGSNTSAPSSQEIDQLIEQLAADLQAGRPVEEYLSQYPQHAELLARVLPTMQALDKLSRSEAWIRCFAQGDAPASSLGDFRILREIGRGGMGVVYEAEQISLSRRVALKVLPFAAVLDPKQLVRFKNEALAAASLDHPHVVDVLGVGCDRGTHYYAMRYIDGCSLAHVISELQAAQHRSRGSEIEPSADPQSDQQEPKRAAGDTYPLALVTTLRATERSHGAPERLRKITALIADAADALHHAHEQGVIHRDIKPSNLLVDNRGKMWVTDFGLAHIESGATLTTTGDFLGTLRYMSPEQASGSRLGVDRRTDIYSLGATLYELLTLRPVFVGENRVDLLRQVVHNEPQAPRLYDKSISVDLETITLKALAKDPADRYNTAGELAADLRRYLDCRPITARPPTLAARFAKWSNRNRSLTRGLVAVLVVVSICTGIGALVVSQERNKSALERQRRGELERLAAQRSAVIEERNYVANVSLAAWAWRSADLTRSKQYLLACVPSGDRPDHRGVEWKYLWRLVHSVREPVARHDGKAFAATFSPDGRLLATAGEDGARVWDADQILNGTSSPPIRRLRPNEHDINSVSFSPDGKLLATSGDDSKIRIWDTATWEPTREIALAYDVRIVRFSPDGKLLGAAEYDNDRRGLKERPKGRIWRTRDWTELQWPTLSEAGVLNVAFSADSSHCALPCISGHLRIVRTEDGQEVSEGNGYYVSSIRAASFHPTRPLIALGTESGRLSLCHLHAYQGVLDLEHGGRVESVVFANSGSWFATAGDLTARVWESFHGERTPVCTHVFPHDSHVWDAVPSPDGKHLVTVAGDGAVRSWRLREPHDVRSVVRNQTWAQSLCFLPDNRLLVAGPREVRELNVQSDGDDIPFFEGSISNMVVSADGKYVATTRYGGTCDVWDAATRSLVRTWSQDELGVDTTSFPFYTGCLSFHAGDRILAVARGKRRPLFVDLQSGKQLDSPLPMVEQADTLMFSPDGRFLAVGTGSQCRVFEWPAGRMVHEMHDATKYIFSQDGRLFARAESHKVTIWPTDTWSPPAAIPVYPLGIHDLAFSRDHQTLVLATPTGVQLIHVSTGFAMMSLPGGAVTRLAFSPDGKVLAGCNNIDIVLVWHLDAVPAYWGQPPDAHVERTSVQSKAPP